MYLSLSVCCGGLSHPLSGLPNRGSVAYAKMGQQEHAQMKRKIATALALVGFCVSRQPVSAKSIEQLFLKCTFSGSSQSAGTDPFISKDEVAIYRIRNGYIAAWNPESGEFQDNKCDLSNGYKVYSKKMPSDTRKILL